MEINGMEANNSAAANNGTAAGASSTHASTEGQQMDTSEGYDYEVFLSFRGPDTRATFTDFLWTLLEVEGIRAFKDDESLRKGEEFEPKLLQAINQSKISIPIFSKDYAFSPWCLKELVQMVKCRGKNKQLIKPIFYDVAPAEVRHQTGNYAEAFKVHEQKGRYDAETMQEWKNALSEVGKLHGWDLHSEGDRRREGASAKRVTQEVFNDLKKACLVEPDCSVDVDDMRKIKDMIAVETSQTRIIGIHGMGGIGKTTIAKKIYNELSNEFEHCCFLSNIREMADRRGIEYLQRQLIHTVLKKESPDIKNMEDGIKMIQERLRTKKVLLLLDDVDHKEHMDALVGKKNWFGEGSKLIITTRNKEVLKVPEGIISYEVNGMNYVQSLRLFCKHAFKSDSPLPQYKNQSKRAIDIAGRLPLALEIIGSLLRHTKKEMWDATLKMLESVPSDKVQSKLKISYEALDFRQKRIFLDIACLFIGCDKDILIHYWDESIFFPKETMKVLQNLSLIKIGENNEVWMHDQLRDLGREMVREKSDTKIEKQSRVWNPKEGLNLLRRRKGKKEVEALRLKFDDQQQYFTYEGFKNLLNLRFLEVRGSMENFRAENKLLWNGSASDIPATYENSYLLPQLRWLSWHDIPPKFNVTKFSMEEVIFLDLSNSKIKNDWNGWSCMEVMKNLKFLNLSYCYCLEKLPDTLVNLKSLVELDISYTSIKELPDSIGKLKSLKVAKMRELGMRKIPPSFWTMEKFEEINFVKSSITEEFYVGIGDGIYRNQSLRILTLTGANIHALPPRLPESLLELRLGELCMETYPDLSNLINLKELDLAFGRSRYDSNGKECGVMEDPMPQWIGKLSKLESLALAFHCETDPPTDISLPPRLKSLSLYCPNLRCLPRLPSSLSSLELNGCSSLDSMEDVSNLKNLSSLYIRATVITEIPGLGCLENLRDLFLEKLIQLVRLPDLSNLNSLRILQVSYCDKLVEIQLPRCLKGLRIFSCSSLRNLPNLSSLERRHVEISRCYSLNEEVRQFLNLL